MLSGIAVLDTLKLDHRKDGKLSAKASLDVGGVRLLLERSMSRDEALELARHLGEELELALVVPVRPAVRPAPVKDTPAPRPAPALAQPKKAAKAATPGKYICPKCKIADRPQHCGGLCRQCYDKIYYGARKARAKAQKAGKKAPAAKMLAAVVYAYGATEAAHRLGVDKDLVGAWRDGTEPSQLQRDLLVEVYAAVAYDNYKRQHGLGDAVFDETLAATLDDLAGAQRTA